MATSRDPLFDRGRLVGTGPLVAAIGGCTLVLTAVFVGVVALVSGETAGLVERLPLYVLASAVAFLAVLLVASHLFVYLLSAAVIASGLGYWAARNRRDVRDLAGSDHL